MNNKPRLHSCRSSNFPVVVKASGLWNDQMNTYTYIYGRECVLIYIVHKCVYRSLDVSTCHSAWAWARARERVYITLYYCVLYINLYECVCVCAPFSYAMLCVYMFEWRHFNSEWDFLSFIYVPIESVDFISCRTWVPTRFLPLSLSLSFTPPFSPGLLAIWCVCVCVFVCCHEEHENRETCALGSVGAVMWKARWEWK